MTLRVLDGFKYSREETFFHRRDPRAKIALTLGVTILSLVTMNLWVQITLFLIIVLFIGLSRSMRSWINSIRAAVILAGLIFILNYAFKGSIELSVAFVVRFLVLLSVFSLFFLTTSPDRLGLALESLRLPHRFAFTFTTAIRMVPTIGRDAQNIVDAQRSRGLELDSGNIFSRVKNYLPVLIPLVVGAVRRSIEMAEALECRAFGVGRRTSLEQLRMQTTDYAIVVFSATPLLIYFMLQARLLP